MTAGPPLHIGKTGEKTPLQLARVMITMRIDARDIVHGIEVISLLHVSKPQRAAVAVTRLQVHLDIQLIDVCIAVLVV